MMKEDLNKTISSYNAEADEALAFVEGNVNGSHGPHGLQPANDNEQLSFEFLQMAAAVVAMREGEMA